METKSQRDMRLEIQNLRFVIKGTAEGSETHTKAAKKLESLEKLYSVMFGDLMITQEIPRPRRQREITLSPTGEAKHGSFILIGKEGK